MSLPPEIWMLVIEQRLRQIADARKFNLVAAVKFLASVQLVSRDWRTWVDSLIIWQFVWDIFVTALPPPPLFPKWLSRISKQGEYIPTPEIQYVSPRDDIRYLITPIRIKLCLRAVKKNAAAIYFGSNMSHYFDHFGDSHTEFVRIWIAPYDRVGDVKYLVENNNKFILHVNYRHGYYDSLIGAVLSFSEVPIFQIFDLVKGSIIAEHRPA